jgi:hypothetical protein
MGEVRTEITLVNIGDQSAATGDLSRRIKSGR